MNIYQGYQGEKTMKNTKKILLLPILFAFLFIFGAWTPQTETTTRYADQPFLSTYAQETVNYTRKVIVEQNTTDGQSPMYSPNSGQTNACGAVAGAEIVAFYDKYYPEMIPGWDSYFTSNGKYRLKDSTYVPALMNELYTLMRTNVDDVGVSENDFKNGLKTYINNKGYSISYQSVISGNNVNYSACKSAIDNNKVIVLFAKAGDVYTISSGTGFDTITPTNIAGAHIMVAYGYKQIQYYNAGGVFRTDIYLEVAMGQSTIKTASYKINPHNLNAAYVINIG